MKQFRNVSVAKVVIDLVWAAVLFEEASFVLEDLLWDSWHACDLSEVPSVEGCAAPDKRKSWDWIFDLVFEGGRAKRNL